jgi:hypothetical protein
MAKPFSGEGVSGGLNAEVHIVFQSQKRLPTTLKDIGELSRKIPEFAWKTGEINIMLPHLPKQWGLLCG